MDHACGCRDDEYGEVIKFCRTCAIGLEQGSDEWRRARTGWFTSSRCADAFARIKSGWGASRANYRAELICERLSGVPYDSGYSNHYMDRGHKIEPKAVLAYELAAGVEAQPTGFWQHPFIALAGSSPDRLIGTDGMLEAKARTTAIHFDLILTGTIPQKYIDQMQFGMACTDRVWCDFVSYDPRAPAPYDLKVIRIHRDIIRIAELERQGRIFLEEVDEHMRALEAKSATGFVFTDTQNGNNLTAQLTDSVEMLAKVVPIKKKGSKRNG